MSIPTLQWERIDGNLGGVLLYRTPVPEGWLVRAVSSVPYPHSITFVPDPDRLWAPSIPSKSGEIIRQMIRATQV